MGAPPVGEGAASPQFEPRAMPELHQIVGGILRDIAQARVTSDVYSKHVSRYYEQDPLLRRFPVPRAEIEDVDLDLKFVVGEITEDPSGRSGEEPATATILARASFDLAHLIAGRLAVAPLARPEPKKEEALESFRARLGSTPWRIDLQSDLLRYFERNQGSLITEGALDRESAVRGLREVVGAFIESHLRLVELEPQDWPELGGALGDALVQPVEQLGERVRMALTLGGDRRIDVEVTAGVLREAPDQVVSSLKLKATVKNYMWSEIGKVDGRTWRKLGPE